MAVASAEASTIFLPANPANLAVAPKSPYVLLNVPIEARFDPPSSANFLASDVIFPNKTDDDFSPANIAAWACGNASAACWYLGSFTAPDKSMANPSD